MKLQSSYVFLDNPYKKEANENKKSSDKVFEAKFDKSVYSYIWESFPYGQDVSVPGKFYEKKYIWSVEKGKNIYKVEFIYNDVIEVKYLDISVEGKSKTQIIECLEYIQDKLMNSGISGDYIDIVSYDAISEYYCNKIFAKLNTLERNLRKLLFNIYTLNFGKNYYQKTINDDLQGKIKGVINSNSSKAKKKKLKETFNVDNSEAKTIEYLQQFFYSVEFGDVQALLFEKNWTQINEETRDKFLSEHGDLTLLSDDELRKAFSNISPQSDWERFFSDKIGTVDIEATIEKIRVYRNTIAHLKKFDREDYYKCNKLITNFNADIVKAIRLTEDVDFAQKNGGLFPGSFSVFVDGINIAYEKTDSVTYKFMQQQTVQRLINYYHAFHKIMADKS